MSTEPIELVAKTTGNVVGVVCGKCQCVSTDMLIGCWGGQHEDRVASHCRSCRDKLWAEKKEATERAAFDRAEKVTAAEWNGEYVWSERFEEIFDNVGDLLEQHAHEGEFPPPYVWECERVDLSLDASDILGSATERQDAWEGVRDMVSSEAEIELQALLDGWLAKHHVHWWCEGKRTAVLLSSVEECGIKDETATETQA